MQRLIHAALLSALCVLVVSSPASARHSHHLGYHKQIHVAQLIVCDHLGCRETVKIVKRVGKIVSRKRHYDAPIDANANITTNLIQRARVYLGQTASEIGVRRTQWCAAFLRHLGVKGVDDRAISFRHLPHVSPQVGAIAVYAHHVGIVTGFEGRYPILISGNSYQRRVYEGVYQRIPIAYVRADLPYRSASIY